MEKFIGIFILLLIPAFQLFSQKISFTYDADGNMESRYVVTLRSVTTQDEEEEAPARMISVESGGQKIIIYPNPTKGEIQVDIIPLNTEEENFMHIFDASGRLLETKKILSEHTFLEISGTPGVYLLNIHLGENITKWKIIKQ